MGYSQLLCGGSLKSRLRIEIILSEQILRLSDRIRRQYFLLNDGNS